MSMPSLRPTRTMRRVLKVLLDKDDGELYGLRIAREARPSRFSFVTGWRSGAIAPILMCLEREGWVTSRWEDLGPEAEAAFPGRWTPRKRFYSLHPDFREHARHLVRRKRGTH